MLKKIKKLIFITLLGIIYVFGFNTSALAASCTSSGGSYTYSGQALKYQRDDTTIGVFNDYRYQGQGGMVWGMQCFGDAGADRDVYWTMTVNSAPVAGYTDVYPTNVDGIGVRYNFALNSGNFCPIGFEDHIANSTRTYTCHLSQNTSPSFSLGASIQFVKTKAKIYSGVITSIPSVSSYYTLNNQSGQGNLNMVWTGGGSVVVTVMACSITTPNVNVALDPVLDSSFSGINSTKGAKNFTIGLQCDAGARINASVSFTKNTDTSNSSVIKLSGAGNPGVATGVGIQLLYDGTLLRNNTNVVLKTSTGGQEFPAGSFTARYFQTLSTVTPGDANASATLNLTYQ